MKYSQARKHLKTMTWSVQKARSITREGLEGVVSQEVNEYFHPWILGKKCPLPVLLRITEGEFVPLDFYNMMVIANRFAPEIGIIAVGQDENFPVEADVNWLKGWDPE